MSRVSYFWGFMKFPGRRKTKHYFPVSDKGRVTLDTTPQQNKNTHYIVGIDQLLVDIEIEVS
jgi:inosine kinase